MSGESGDLPPTNPQREKIPQNRLESIRKFALEHFPDPNRLDEVADLEGLFLAQLRENVGLLAAEKYLSADGQSYVLPCDIRETNGEAHIFIPRELNWLFIRESPVAGNHPPFSETYGGKEKHKFAEAFERVSGLNIHSIIDANELMWMGTGADRTPYHQLQLTGEGLRLELGGQPSLAQTELINGIQKRLENTGIRLEVLIKENEARSGLLPEASEWAKGIEIPRFPMYLTIDRFRGRAHSAVVNSEGHIVATTTEMPKGNFLVGYGYMEMQLREDGIEETDGNMVGFYFDPNARNHNEARSAYVLSKVVSQRWYKDTKQDYADLREELEKELQVYEAIEIADKWAYRKDVVDKHLPFKLSVGGYKIPCGMRATLNPASGELTVEMLTSSASKGDKIKSILLERSADKIAQELKDRFENETRGIIPTGVTLKATSKVMIVKEKE